MVARLRIEKTKLADGREVYGGPVKTAKPDKDVARTVTVACKLPNGLVLQTFYLGQEFIPGPVTQGQAGRISVEVFKRNPTTYTIKGNRVPFGVMPDFPIDHGYAFTSGIPKAFWETWLEQVGQHMDAVKHGLVFAFEAIDDVRYEVANNKDAKTGLEPIDPEKSPVAKVSKKTDD